MKDFETGALDPARLFSFAPDPERAAFLDRRMHRELRESLSHLADAYEDIEVAEALISVLTRLNNGERFPPEAFGEYFELGEACLNNAAETARSSAQRLAQMPVRGPRSIVCKGSGTELERALSLRMGAGFDAYAPVSEAAGEAFSARFDAGMALIRDHGPELAGELDQILHQIILVTEPQDAGYEFHGASHYQFWGLLMINPRHHPTPLAMAEVIGHEAAHSLLFGLTVEEPLVLNPDEELFSSPLRDDPRPMDGIYHATFVSARMAWLMERIAARAPDLAEQATVEAAKDRDNFWKGYGVVAEHGRLSETGAAIMAGALAYIEGRGP